MNLRIILSCFCLFLSALCLSGQEVDFLKGLVVDLTDRSPVPFATVRVQGEAVGVITNADGSFKFPERFLKLGDSLEISSLGYKTKTVRLFNWDPEHTKIISLEQEIEILDEVVVTGQRQRLNAREIISRALTRINQNYPNSPYSYIGYYRDYQKKEEEYFNLNEAIVQIFDQGFIEDDFETTQAQILRLRKNMSFPRDSSAAVPYNYTSRAKIIPMAFMENYGGNELQILRIHDAIRNFNTGSFSYVDRLQTDFIRNHQFRREGIFNYQGDQIYRISIRKQEDKIRVRGEIYISATDYGILKLDYQAFILSIQSNPLQFATMASAKEKLLYRVLVEYSHRDRYHLNYLSFQNHFEIRPRPIFFVETVNFDKNQRYFELVFSTRPMEKDALKPTKYKLNYFGEKIKIDEVSISADGKRVALIPKKTLSQSQILTMIDKESFNQENFKIKIGIIRDENGNLLDEVKKEEVDQFREFFVQKLLRESEIPSEEELMLKNRPLFEEQPQFFGDIDGDYWMNTPLKK